MKFVQKGQLECHVKWRGFIDEENDWLPVEHLEENVPDLYLEHISELSQKARKASAKSPTDSINEQCSWVDDGLRSSGNDLELVGSDLELCRFLRYVGFVCNRIPSCGGAQPALTSHDGVGTAVYNQRTYQVYRT